MSTVHAKTVVAADDPSYEVGSDEWNAAHNTSAVDGEIVTLASRAVGSGTNRFVAAGTGRLQVLTNGQPFIGSYGLGSVSIYDDTYRLQYKRATLNSTARATLVGTGELFIFDLAPVGRLILAGRGG